MSDIYFNVMFKSSITQRGAKLQLHLDLTAGTQRHLLVGSQHSRNWEPSSSDFLFIVLSFCSHVASCFPEQPFVNFSGSTFSLLSEKLQNKILFASSWWTRVFERIFGLWSTPNTFVLKTREALFTSFASFWLSFLCICCFALCGCLICLPLYCNCECFAFLLFRFKQNDPMTPSSSRCRACLSRCTYLPMLCEVSRWRSSQVFALTDGSSSLNKTFSCFRKPAEEEPVCTFPNFPPF